jgi:hypothetical protein
MLVGVLLCFVISEVSASGAIFSPAACDFSVDFPNEYRIKDITLGGVHALGAASGRGAGNTRFSAECWPIEKNVSIEEIGRRIERQANQRGLSISSNIIDKNDKRGEQAILSGILTVEGKKIHMKLISIIGPSTRLDLIIVDSELLKQSHIDFRNSIKQK